MEPAPQNGRPSGAPKLSYKYQRLRERLREAIDRGELSGHLPGERELARRYGANAKTLNKALNDLATEGLLVRHVGRGTCVAKDLASDPVLGRSRAYRWVVGEGAGDVFAELAYTRAANIAREAGHELVQIDAPLDDAGHLPVRALTPGQLRELDGLIVYATQASRPLLADLIRRHLPFMLVNTLSDDATTNTVNPDYMRGAYELTEHLIGLGHADIRIVACPGSSPALSLAVTGHETAMRRHRLTSEPTVMLETDDRDADRAALDYVYRAGHGATAAVIVGGYVVDASHDRAHGRISIAAALEPAQTFGPDALLTTYDVDLERIIDWAMRVLIDAAPAQRPQQVIVPGRLVTRGTPSAANPGQHVMSQPREAVL